MTDVADLMEHLTRLTNLTSFIFGDQSKFNATKPRSVDATSCGVSNLTNLKRMLGLPVPSSVWKQLTRLEEFNVPNGNLSLSDMMAIAKTLTNLHTLTIRTYEEVENPFECITDAHSKLTSLTLQLDRVGSWSENDLQRLARLKKFTIHMADYDQRSFNRPRRLSLKYMTALEELTTDAEIESINSSNLRVFQKYGMTEGDKKVIAQASGLTKLVYVMLEDDTEYLRALPNLKSISIYPREEENANLGRKFSILGSLSTTRLSVLNLNCVQGAVDLGYLTQLQSIVELTMDDTLGINASHLLNLTNLTSLVIRNNSNSIADEDKRLITALPALTKLRKLHFYPSTVRSDILVDISSLTNLEHLALIIDEVTGLEHCTNLTYLMFGARDQNKRRSLPFLAMLTNLQHLHCHAYSDAGQYVTTLANLHSLYLLQLDSEEEVGSFTVLTRLTQLTVTQDNNRNDIQVTKLTTLQDLSLYKTHADMTLIHSSLPYLRTYRINSWY